ncbi:MAG: sulfatase [Planctomycetia bacterium]|nr:sulfatase [Planctomycetia bacterium]
MNALRSMARAAATLALVAALGSGAGCGDPKPPPAVRTLVLVTVDTLRRDHVSAYVPAGGTVHVATPAIDALARTGVRFDDARTPTPLTLPAHTTMLSARAPGAHGVRSNSASRIPPRAARRWPLLAETLADAGWCCGAFTSAGPLVTRYGLDAGFDTYDDGALDDFSGGGFAERPGLQTVERALAWLAALPRERRVFLWVHVFEPHQPYRPDYRTDVTQADAVVGTLVAGLAAARGPDAAVLLTSDHGEALGELGEPSHGLLLAESVLRVPFLLVAPGLAPGVRSDPVDLADVAPTLARLAGTTFPTPEGPLAGRDLLAGPAPADRPRVAEGLHAFHQYRWAQLTCAVVGRHKLEDRGDAPGRRVLFRLSDTPPGQDAGVAAESAPEAEAPAAALRAYRRAESGAPDRGAAGAGGYGAGGAVGPLEDPAANGRRLDPYAVVTDAGRLDRAAAAVLAQPVTAERVRAALRDLDTLEARDPTNPAIAFWRGRALRTLAKTPADHAAARATFLAALDRGRADADTLLLAGRSALAEGDAPGTLALLSAWHDRIPPDARLADLEADAAGRVGDTPRREAATARAAALRKAPAAQAPPGGCR